MSIIDKVTSRSEFLADIHENRLKHPQRFPRPVANKNEDEVALQIKQYRESKKAKNPSKKSKIMTLKDLEENEYIKENPQEVYNSIESFTDHKNLEIRAFELVRFM